MEKICQLKSQDKQYIPNEQQPFSVISLPYVVKEQVSYNDKFENKLPYNYQENHEDEYYSENDYIKKNQEYYFKCNDDDKDDAENNINNNNNNGYSYGRKYSKSAEKKYSIQRKFFNYEINLSSFEEDELEKAENQQNIPESDRIHIENSDFQRKYYSKEINADDAGFYQKNKYMENSPTSEAIDNTEKIISTKIGKSVFLKTDFIEDFDPNDKKSYHNKKRLQTVKIVKEGILKKKSPWFHYNTRKVVIDSTPRVEYIDPVSNKVKVWIIETPSIIFLIFPFD